MHWWYSNFDRTKQRCEISFMSLAVKGMIRIANEESNSLSSFVILTMSLITMLIKEVPELECRPIVPTKARKDFFWGGQNLKPFSEKKL